MRRILRPPKGPAALGLACAAVALLAHTSAPVHAQPDSADPAAAEALFDQGRRLMKAGKYAEACGKFEASQRLESSVGALLNLGDCLEKIGRTASAWSSFRMAADLSQRERDTKRRDYARGRADKLAPVLVRLTLVVAEGDVVDGLTVKKNGEPLDAVLWNQSVPVDPGNYEIEATAPGHKPWKQRVEIATGSGETRIEIARLVAEPRPKEDELKKADKADKKVVEDKGYTDVLTIEPRDRRSRPMPLGRKVALSLAGLGVAGLANGIAFGLWGENTFNRALEFCDSDYLCDAEGVDLGDKAKRRGLVANISFGVAAAALGTGVALWVLSSPDKKKRGGWRSARVSPAVSPGLVTLDMEMKF